MGDVEVKCLIGRAFILKAEGLSCVILLLDGVGNAYKAMCKFFLFRIAHGSSSAIWKSAEQEMGTQPIVFGTLIAVSSDLPCFECLWRWNVVRAKVVRGVIGKGAKTSAASGLADNTTESPCEIRPVFSGDSGGGAVLRRRPCRRSTSRSFREFAASAYGPSRD